MDSNISPSMNDGVSSAIPRSNLCNGTRWNADSSAVSGRGRPHSDIIRVYKKRRPPSSDAKRNASHWIPEPDLISDGPILRSGLKIRVLKLKQKPFSGHSLLFFSDTHIRSARVRCFFPFLEQDGEMRWLNSAFTELFDSIPKPTWILFGGDLSGEASRMKRSIEFLQKEVPNGTHKVAVCGNWELRRRWLSKSTWRTIFSESGFEFLSNESMRCSGLTIHGLDDEKEGLPCIPGTYSNQEFSCILMHNPDSAASLLTKETLASAPLLLAGHTHGGQIRVPFLGALTTFSSFGKHFEYGAYRHEETNAILYITAGLGATWFRIRVCCPPEILLVNFT